MTSRVGFVVAVAAFGLVACSGSAPVPEQTSAAGGGADAEGSPSASASSAGGAPDAVPADPTAEGGSPTARVADGLQALYTFDAGEGTVVPDASQVGAPADLVIWDVDDYRHIAYRFGDPPIRAVWKRGETVAVSL